MHNVMAHYFITSEEDPQASAIEIAQAQRIKLFNSYGQKARIVELNYNHWHESVQNILGTQGKVINIFQFFQQLKFIHDPAMDRVLINQILQQPGFEVKNNSAYFNGNKRIKIKFRANRLHTVSYLDQYEFLDRKDFYDEGKLSYSDFFEDKGRVVLRQYYDNEVRPVIMFHYRGGQNNIPILSLIQVHYRGKWFNFDSEVDFRAFFLDQLAQNDLHSVFYGDRSDYALAPFRAMHQTVPRYLIFHSTVTVDSKRTGQVYEAYRGISNMLGEGSLNGLISSTNSEADDIAEIFKTDHSYAIPVTYATNVKRVSFATRKPYSLVAVARLDAVKQLDHIINAVVKLKNKYPELTLSFYGLQSSSADFSTGPKLKQKVKELNAESYIHFGGFIEDLTDIYNSAWIEVLTSKYEGFAMALLEAQEHGTPAVAYNVNYGPSDIIVNNKTGNLLTPDDQNQLYQTLNYLLNNPNVLEAYSQNAYQEIQRYSFKNVAMAWQDFQKQENLIF